MSQSKRRKSELTTLITAFETASSLDLSGIEKCQLSTRQKEWYLVSKFGLTSVNRVSRALRIIPDSITDSHKTQMLVQLSGIDDEYEVKELA